MPNPKNFQPQGTWDVHRSIRLKSISDLGKLEHLVSTLAAMEGIGEAHLEPGKRRIVLTYNQSTMDYRTIILFLEHNGYFADSGWWQKIKGAFFQFTDNNAHDNAHSPPPACCNKPPR